MGYCSGNPDPVPDSREDEHVALEVLFLERQQYCFRLICQRACKSMCLAGAVRQTNRRHDSDAG